MGKGGARNAGAGRRAYLKRFGQAAINTGPSLNKVVVAEYHDRAKSLRLGPWKDVGHGPAVLQKMARIDDLLVEAEKISNKERWVYLVNRKRPDGSPIVRVRLFIDKSDKTCRLIREDFREKVFKMSIPYENREIAVLRHKTLDVMWAKEVRL